jgi:hypothetical protein
MRIKVHEELGDGNCLFRALSYLVFNTSKYHNIMRDNICNELDRILPNDLTIDNMNKKDYINEMKKDTVFGSLIEIGGFASLYGKVNIYNKKDKSYEKIKISQDWLVNVYNAKKPEKNINNKYNIIRNNLHYDSLIVN